jgi:hypothetical protein
MILQKTLYFYNAFITHNEQITNIHLSDLLDGIRALNVQNRLKRIKQGNACLMNMKDPTENEHDINDRKVVLGKFRDNKPFLGNRGTDRIEEIMDDVLELTSIFYRRNSRLLVVEYNHYGLRPNGLQNYLSSFLPINEDQNWGVVLSPIEPQLGFSDIEQSHDIRKVDFRMDLTARTRRLYNQEQGENRSVIGEILRQSIDTHLQFGANIAHIGFGNGRKRGNDVIDSASLIPLLRGLDLESDVFESVKVKYKSPTTRKIEDLDIKNLGVLKESIDIDQDGWEYLCDILERNFYGGARTGENAHLDYEIEQHVDLPALVYNVNV